jgi:hypothetical protein
MCVVFYGCENWWLKLREEDRLRPFENRVLRGIFGPKSDEVTGEWRKLINEQLTEMCFSPDIIRLAKSRIIKWAGHVVCMEEKKSAFVVLVGKRECMRPIVKPRHRFWNNIKMDIQEIVLVHGLD